MATPPRPSCPPTTSPPTCSRPLHTRLAAAGLAQYETSAYARPGHASRHNLNYWQFGDYLGIGAGAHSKLSFHDRITWQMRTKHPQQYMDAVRTRSHIADTRTLTRTDLPFEFMMNALRLIDGVPAALFEECTGPPLMLCSRALTRGHALGLLEIRADRLQPVCAGSKS